MSTVKMCDLCGVTHREGSPAITLVPLPAKLLPEQLQQAIRPSASNASDRVLDLCPGCTEAFMAAIDRLITERLSAGDHAPTTADRPA